MTDEYPMQSSSLNIQTTGLEFLTAVASSLLESPSPRSSPSAIRTTRRHSTGSWNSFLTSKISKRAHMPDTSQDLQTSSNSTEKRLRRTSKRIMSSFSTSSNQIASLDSFDSALINFTSKARPLEFLDTAKRNYAMHDSEMSVSSCSSFDASDNEGTYPSTPVPLPLSSPVSLSSRAQNRMSQAYSDNFPAAFELSPIMEDPCTFEEMDDILAYYSDSPILGRINESRTHSEFAFDETDWEPEPISDTDTGFEVNIPDVDNVKIEPKRARRMSFVLKSTDHENNALSSRTEFHAESNAYKDLLSPPSLVLTFPTPEMQDTSTLPEPVLLVAEPNQLLTSPSIPETPPRRSQDHSYNRLEPPTPMPPLPRCTSCGFGFSFDVTGSTDMLHRPVNPCDKCQAQWERCRKWYGKRGWEVERSEVAPDQNADIKEEKGLNLRVSRRFSQIVEGVFMTNPRNRRFSADPSTRGTTSTSKRSSRRISFMDWAHPKQKTTRNSLKNEDFSSQIKVDAHPSKLNRLGTRVQDYGLFPDVGLQPNDLQSPNITPIKGVLRKFERLRPFSKSKGAKNQPKNKRRRSFLEFGISGSDHRFNFATSRFQDF
ncbi:hypothetical protein GGU10DRAFT_371712 [Lentinula aff. detonsa]|uniref:Uncharacterized protein n=1 Tax=Lentinula aff. detonsa TaxID=2804958 RepID=A0AA38NRM1_9AGAR|nr:hypothetical protein GGU10DRAFT_371712 [Lentinula aff. detonsa]